MTENQPRSLFDPEIVAPGAGRVAEASSTRGSRSATR